jgi:hypothetical protein
MRISDIMFFISALLLVALAIYCLTEAHKHDK